MTLVLAKQHAVVTGGGRGIGAAIARELARLGADVTVMGRDEARLARTVAELGELGPGRFGKVKIDVTDRSSVTRAFAQAREQGGSIHILVNNAGAVESAPLVKADPNIWDRMIGLNLTAVYLCIHEVLPAMILARQGRIINVASTAGLRGYPYVAAYCAAKHGVVGLTRALALEVAAQGVTVNAVCPGYTDTDLLGTSAERVAAKTKRTPEEIRAQFLSQVPQGRFVTPEEVGSMVGWLAQPGQQSITGQAYVISGGEVMA